MENEKIFKMLKALIKSYDKLIEKCEKYIDVDEIKNLKKYNLKAKKIILEEFSEELK